MATKRVSANSWLKASGVRVSNKLSTIGELATVSIVVKNLSLIYLGKGQLFVIQRIAVVIRGPLEALPKQSTLTQHSSQIGFNRMLKKKPQLQNLQLRSGFRIVAQS